MRTFSKFSKKRKYSSPFPDLVKLLFLPLLFTVPWLLWLVAYLLKIISYLYLVEGMVPAIFLGLGLSVSANYLFMAVPYSLLRKIQKKRFSFWHLLIFWIVGIALWLLQVEPFASLSLKLVGIAATGRW